MTVYRKFTNLFGFEIIEYIAKLHNYQIEVVEATEESEQMELVEDLVQILTVFSYRLQCRRANKAKKMIEDLIAGDPDD